MESAPSSPTPDELRSQAWHGLANRVTSLYWFNLSLKSLAKFPDLIEPITRVNREIRMLDEIFLTGDAYEYRRIRIRRRTGLGSHIDCNTNIESCWPLMICGYRPDPIKREFVFSKRSATR